MSLPAIAPYPMPGPGDLPDNRVDWRPDPRRALLLVHDMQNHFVNAFTPRREPLNELMTNIGLLRATGVPVVFSAQPGAQDPGRRGLLKDFWGAGIGGDGHSQAIVDELAPAPADVLLTKWRYSAFQRTELLTIMRESGRDQLIICGIYAHIGCLMTACEAFMSDIQTFLVSDAVADFSADYHRMALSYAAERCAVVMPTHRLLDELAATGASHASR
ncbi:isochorismatase family protein [Streptosporangium sp. DT93]|uniref:isochorismatase family protein n=1 Tax=Streptosporangium sp. DT93 TaxID=3393428 RepID=UPI003CEF17D8